MCSLRRLVWLKIGFLFNIRRRSSLSSRSSEWAQPSPHAFVKFPIKEQTDPDAFVLLSRYFDVTQWSFCAVLLQVQHTWCHRPSPSIVLINWRAFLESLNSR